MGTGSKKLALGRHDICHLGTCFSKRQYTPTQICNSYFLLLCNCQWEHFINKTQSLWRAHSDGVCPNCTRHRFDDAGVIAIHWPIRKWHRRLYAEKDRCLGRLNTYPSHSYGTTIWLMFWNRHSNYQEHLSTIKSQSPVPKKITVTSGRNSFFVNLIINVIIWSLVDRTVHVPSLASQGPLASGNKGGSVPTLSPNPSLFRTTRDGAVV